MDLIPFSLSGYTLESYLTKINSGSKIIYWIIIISVITGLILLPFIYVDVTVLARGYFQPDIEKQVVYAPFPGRVIFSSVKSGKRVNKGDTLLIIDSESIRAMKESLSKRIDDNNNSIHDLRRLSVIVSGEDSILMDDLTAPRYRSEYSNFGKQYFIQYCIVTITLLKTKRREILEISSLYYLCLTKTLCYEKLLSNSVISFISGIIYILYKRKKRFSLDHQNGIYA